MGAQTAPYLVIVIKRRTGVIIEPRELPLEGESHAALLAPLRGWPMRTRLPFRAFVVVS